MAAKTKIPNQLFYGDNLEVLRKYIKDETIDLCYIDPPFNSKRTYNQIYKNIGQEDFAQTQAFIDTWTWGDDDENLLNDILTDTRGVYTHQSIDLILGLKKVLGMGSLLSYLVHMTARIGEIYRVLKPTGSFFLHCDPTASHYLKLIVDAIFCSRTGEYQSEIVWKRTSAHSDSNTMGNSHDIILFYTKSDEFVWNKLYQKYDDSYINSHYRRVDKTGRKYRTDNLTAMGLSGGGYEYVWNKVKKIWRMPKERMKQLHDEGRISYTSSGTAEYIRYLDEMPGMPLQDVWSDISPINSQAAERMGYPTQKPEALLERIINATTNKDSVVLDAYCGCGTTVAVAQHLGRRWIGIDITYQSIGLILKRLEDQYSKAVVDAIVLNGVPKDFNSAVALANKTDDKTRKEFEKWIVLTYTNNRGMINVKKGGDEGIDGLAYVLDSDEKNAQVVKKVVFSVKSNKSLSPTVVRDLFGTVERDGAAMGILLTLYPMDNLVNEATKYGLYKNRLFNHNYPKIQVYCAEEILDGLRMSLPVSPEIIKTSKKKSKKDQQGKLDVE